MTTRGLYRWHKAGFYLNMCCAWMDGLLSLLFPFMLVPGFTHAFAAWLSARRAGQLELQMAVEEESKPWHEKLKRNH